MIPIIIIIVAVALLGLVGIYIGYRFSWEDPEAVKIPDASEPEPEDEEDEGAYAARLAAFRKNKLPGLKLAKDAALTEITNIKADNKKRGWLAVVATAVFVTILGMITSALLAIRDMSPEQLTSLIGANAAAEVAELMGPIKDDVATLKGDVSGLKEAGLETARQVGELGKQIGGLKETVRLMTSNTIPRDGIGGGSVTIPESSEAAAERRQRYLQEFRTALALDFTKATQDAVDTARREMGSLKANLEGQVSGLRVTLDERFAAAQADATTARTRAEEARNIATNGIAGVRGELGGVAGRLTRAEAEVAAANGKLGRTENAIGQLGNQLEQTAALARGVQPKPTVATNATVSVRTTWHQGQITVSASAEYPSDTNPDIAAMQLEGLLTHVGNQVGPDFYRADPTDTDKQADFAKAFSRAASIYPKAGTMGGFNIVRIRFVNDRYEKTGAGNGLKVFGN